MDKRGQVRLFLSGLYALKFFYIFKVIPVILDFSLWLLLEKKTQGTDSVIPLFVPDFSHATVNI